MIWVGSKVTTEGWMLESANPEGEFRVIIPRREGVEYGAEHAVIGGEDRFLILHNDVVDGVEGRELRARGSSRVDDPIEHDDADRAPRTTFVSKKSKPLPDTSS